MIESTKFIQVICYHNMTHNKIQEFLDSPFIIIITIQNILKVMMSWGNDNNDNKWQVDYKNWGKGDIIWGNLQNLKLETYFSQSFRPFIICLMVKKGWARIRLKENSRTTNILYYVWYQIQISAIKHKNLLCLDHHISRLKQAKNA